MASGADGDQQENDAAAMELAEESIDAAPDDVLTAAEYIWDFRQMSVTDLFAMTTMKRSPADVAEYAAALRLDPSRSDLSRPVVVSLREWRGNGHDHRFPPLELWDGIHRIVSAAILGVHSLPVAFGTPPGDHKHCEELRSERSRCVPRPR